MDLVRLASLVLIMLAELTQSTTVLNAGNPDAKRLYDDLLSNYNSKKSHPLPS